MKGTIEELWHGNIIPHEDSRTNSKEMKELLGYILKFQMLRLKLDQHKGKKVYGYLDKDY